MTFFLFVVIQSWQNISNTLNDNHDKQQIVSEIKVLTSYAMISCACWNPQLLQRVVCHNCTQNHIFYYIDNTDCVKCCPQFSSSTHLHL